MHTPETDIKHASPTLAEIYRRQRTFILSYSLLILLPLTLSIGYFCYAKGLAHEYGPVTITQTWKLLEGGGRSETSIRGGGSTNRPSRWVYRVWGATKDGRLAFIDVAGYKNFVTYHRGDSVVTRYSFHKEKGEWRWTFLADFSMKTWLIACLIMLLRMRITYKKSQCPPEDPFSTDKNKPME